MAGLQDMVRQLKARPGPGYWIHEDELINYTTGFWVEIWTPCRILLWSLVTTPVFRCLIKICCIVFHSYKLTLLLFIFQMSWPDPSKQLWVPPTFKTRLRKYAAECWPRGRVKKLPHLSKCATWWWRKTRYVFPDFPILNFLFQEATNREWTVIRQNSYCQTVSRG